MCSHSQIRKYFLTACKTKEETADNKFGGGGAIALIVALIASI